MRIAHLGRPGGDPDGFAALREDFVGRNPGYDLAWLPRAVALAAVPRPRIAFVQDGLAVGLAGGARSELGRGDLVVLRPEEALALDRPLGLLVFTVPEPIPDGIPAFLRPDHDALLTDTPGGCATRADAYRRVLLTWLGQNGPFQYRALNCHRVRMQDSFSHYHPEVGGFDEMYLVQEVQPGGRLYTSEQVARIEAPETVGRDEVEGLLREVELAVGDLVWVGRGQMHRAVGGVLAQVITVPGFVPGSEIGVDHHLRAIDERLGLSGAAALPFHLEASERAVVK
jgi:hypothetical protein